MSSPFLSDPHSENNFEAGKRELPSYAHLVVSGIAVLVSTAVAVLPNKPTVEFHGNTTDFLALGCYLLTPLLVVLMLALARASDLKRRSNPYFDVVISERNLKVIAILTAYSFVIGTWHIYQFARLYFVK